MVFDRIREKLRRVLTETEQCATLSEESIQKIETQYRISLPDEYRRFLLLIGDLDVGPGNCYKLSEGLTDNSDKSFPLAQPFLGFHAVLPDQKVDTLGLYAQWDAIPRDHGVMDLCAYGSGIEAVLVLNGNAQGQVWIRHADSAYYGPFGGAEPLHDEEAPDLFPNLAPTEYSFTQWYEHWLDAMLKQS